MTSTLVARGVDPAKAKKLQKTNQTIKNDSFQGVVLAVGIDREIFQLVSQEHFAGASKKVVHKCLKWHTTKTQYLQAMQRGGVRYALDGTPAGEITAYQQQLAGEWLAKKASKAKA